MTSYWGAQPDTSVRQLRMELREFFEREIPLKTYISWLAHEGEKLAGVGGMKVYQIPGNFRVPNGMMAYILNMYTYPDFRNQGIATEIVKRLVETGQELGVRLFDLHATKAGEPVYLKAGFKLHDEPSYRKLIL